MMAMLVQTEPTQQTRLRGVMMVVWLDDDIDWTLPDWGQTQDFVQ